jgi:hypothetical protein
VTFDEWRESERIVTSPVDVGFMRAAWNAATEEAARAADAEKKMAWRDFQDADGDEDDKCIYLIGRRGAAGKLARQIRAMKSGEQPAPAHSKQSAALDAA